MQRKSKASSGECGCMVGGGGLEAGLATRGLRRRRDHTSGKPCPQAMAGEPERVTSWLAWG